MRFLALVLCGLCATFSQAVDPAPTSLKPAMKYSEVREVAPGVFFRFSQISATDPMLPFGGSNNAWIVFKDYVVVIDANFPKEARDVIAEIKKTTKKPIRYVFDTHHHGDHAWGNAVWAAEGAAVIGHRFCAEQMKGDAKEFANAAKGPNARKDVAESTFRVPDLLFDDKLVLDDGTQRVEFLFMGHAHTSGDAVAWIPKHGILCTGDACVNGAFNFMGHSDSGSWVRALERMEALAPKMICPGHGPVDGPGLVQRQKRYFIELRDAVRKAVRENKTLDDAKTALDIPWYKEWTGVAVKADNIAHVYAELTGTIAPWDLREGFGLVEGASPSKDDKDWKAPKRILVPSSLPPAKLRELKRVAPEIEFIAARTATEAVEMSRSKEFPIDAVIGFVGLPEKPDCKWIHLADASGTLHLSEGGKSEGGKITVTGTEGIAAPERSESGLGLIMAGISKVHAQKPARITMSGKKIVIVGNSPTSEVLARRLSTMGSRVVLVEEKTGPAPKGFAKRVAIDSLIDEVADADVVVACSPIGSRGTLIPQTLPELKKETILVILGPAAHQAGDLVTAHEKHGGMVAANWPARQILALEADREKGANPFLTTGYLDRAWRLQRENVRRFAAGEKLLAVIDPRVGY